MYGFQRLKKTLKSGAGTKEFKQLAAASIIVAISFVLYAAGTKFLLLPVLIAVNAWILPLPRIFSSWFGRAVVSFLLVMTTLQIAASLQFLMFPKSGFITLTFFLMLLQAAIWLIAPARKPGKPPIISTSDWCGLLVVVGFLLWFTPILTGRDSVDRIATIATYQAVDSTTHYSVIAENTAAGHFNYAPNHYYPYGFHLAVGYVQDTLFGNQSNLSWRKNVFLYFADYLVYGSLLGYVAYFLCLSWLKSLKEKLVPDGWAWIKLLTALCLAPVMAIMYLLPFIHEGFLNYYYVCLTLLLGIIFLTEMRYFRVSKDDSLNVSQDTYGSWGLFAYVLLLFGASASWPLILPPFAVTGVLFLAPGRLDRKTLISRLWTFKALPIVAAFALQLLPLYFQVRYGTATGQLGFNATGSITPFHSLILLTGVGLVAGLCAWPKLDEAYRRVLMNIFGPLFVLLGILMVCQYFSVGGLRYYSIKVSVLLEMFIVILGVAALVAAFAASKFYEARYAWFFPAVPLLLVALMISLNWNPLKYDRDLLFPRVPWYLKADIKGVAKLGVAGGINNSDTTVLHYQAEHQAFFADMELPYWADLMQYNGTAQAGQKLACMGQVYHDMTFGLFASLSAQEQAYKSDIATCAAAAARQHRPFYIITDAASLPYVRNFVGKTPTLIVGGS